MSLLSEVKIIADKINKLHINDPQIQNYWAELASLLSKDESSTISLLNELDDSDQAEDLSSVFDDLSSKLQSKNFILSIELLQKRFPDAQLENMVQAAKDALIEN